ncbi:MAG: (E)-4-hydroxy-3-methylbut-2-enyl-diphosphate synthase [Bacteroidales bacterium]|nr:(E)-4-hydroxy-3-methylbut-2-enyl-diphosphate synthase [Bacteroidales bacterium]
MWKTNPYNYSRRPTSEVLIGTLKMGGSNPIRLQSMANTNTNDIENSITQCQRIVEAGADLVRLTTQGMKEVDSLRIIRDNVHNKGFNIPFVADVHFNAYVANYAAQHLEKVRINPGNYVSSIKTTSPNKYTDEEYEEEFKKIESRFVEFLKICKIHNTAVRIGVNHGSLSERMLLKWGNTARGMVESCLEFLKICKAQDFSNLVISMKASNTVQMIQAVRLLVERMEKEDYHFPIHLGVTEAGDGEDGRIKSAVGIGGLLAEGIGDTIRVSLSEEPEAEIPVATLLRDYITARSKNKKTIQLKSENPVTIKPFTRRSTFQVKNFGGENLPQVIAKPCNHPTLKADYLLKNNSIINSKGKKHPIYLFDNLPKQNNQEILFLRTHYDELNSELIALLKKNSNIVLLIDANAENPVGEHRAFIHTLMAEKVKNPVVVVGKYNENDLEALQIKASADLGIIFVDGLADAIMIENEGTISNEDILSTSFGILQGARARISKTEFISCPGCGRTHFNLQKVIARVKAKTSHLTGLKIGIMGCIVNGPGEMADADYGYVGGGRGTVMLYKKQECIKKGVPEEKAVDELIELIKKYGDWKEPSF